MCTLYLNLILEQMANRALLSSRIGSYAFIYTYVLFHMDNDSLYSPDPCSYEYFLHTYNLRISA